MTRWYHWAILTGLIALGAGLRFYQITKVGLSPDEFWSSVHLATGRGSVVSRLPPDVLIQSPPKTLLEGAPAWPHIWTGLADVTHPPFYYLVLRWWMDLFGSSDFSTRALSAMLSLAGIVVFFDVVRRMSGAASGLIAAGMMAVAPLQIDFSQDARSYTLLMLLGLLLCRAVLQIEQRGAARGRLAVFGGLLIATALTHYFSLGALVAIGCYVLLRFRGVDRKRALAVMIVSGIITLAAWGPFLVQQRQSLLGRQPWSLEPTNLWYLPWLHAAELPSALLYGRFGLSSAWIAAAVVAYLFPLLWIRRQPWLMLWWFWAVGIIGSLLVYDLVKHARLLIMLRYSLLASAGLYALYAAPLPTRRWWRWMIPAVFLASTLPFTVARIQQGPWDESGDWRGFALVLDQKAGPDDPLIFCPNSFWGLPGIYYLAFSHYAPHSHRPIMYLNAPAQSEALRQISGFQRVWLVGPEGINPSDFLPGWKATFVRGFPNSATIGSLVPEKSDTAATLPSKRPLPKPH
jgi:hypothetical protein